MSEHAAHSSITVDKGQVAQANFGSASAVGMSPLAKFVTENIVSNDAHWAWQNYKSVVLGLQATFRCESLMEVGAGRSPLLDQREYEGLNAKYTTNDISSAELALAPEWSSKACFDISSPPSN